MRDFDSPLSITSRFIAVLAILISFPHSSAAQKLAITMDDLPLNGDLPPGVTRAETARNVVDIFRKHHLPPVYGFVNAVRLEGNADGAEGLKIWATAEPVGNHTYSHMDLEKNSPEAFEHEVELDEPALELLTANGDWHWLRYPYLHEGDTLEKRRAVRTYLKTHNYRIAQVTMDWEDYLWNFAYARCAAKDDKQSIAWLRSSYLNTASSFIDLAREQSKLIFGREINFILLTHLGAFSSTILPDALNLLKMKGFKLVTLQEAESDPAYEADPDAGLTDAGTLLDQMMRVKELRDPPHMDKPYKQLAEICK